MILIFGIRSVCQEVVSIIRIILPSIHRLTLYDTEYAYYNNNKFRDCDPIQTIEGNNGNSDILNNTKDNQSVYCMESNNSDVDNPPQLPPESPLYTLIMPCIHSIIPNDGERILLFSSVY